MAGRTSRPNLFEFATSELSQDAWIAWLIAHVDWDASSEIGACGRAFLCLLLNAGREEKAEPSDVSEILTLQRQYLGVIDVYARVRVAGAVVSLIIEDKVHTSDHGGQLQRYRELIEKDHLAENEIVGVYLKSGFPFSDETARARLAEYGVVDLFVLRDFLRGWSHVRNDILGDLRDRMHDLASRYEALREAIHGADGHLALEGGQREVAQWMFLEEFKRRSKDRGLLERGVNVGGSPWTTLEFLKEPTGSLFWRLELRTEPATRSQQPCLALRHFDWSVRENADRLAARSARLEELRALFADALRGLGTTLRFSPPGTRGRMERDVARLFINADTNRTSVVWEDLPRIYERFAKSLGIDT